MSLSPDVYDLMTDEEKATYESRQGEHESQESRARNNQKRRRETKQAATPKPPEPVLYGKGYFGTRQDGIYFFELDDDESIKDKVFICSPLEVIAQTRDDKGSNHGRLLQWRDTDGVLHTWSMPMALLAGDGLDIRRELLDGGLIISPGKKAREFLLVYIQIAKTDKLARCVDRLGWHDGRYVLPNQTIGVNNEIVVYQNPHLIEPAFSVSGTVEQWRANLAVLAVENSRLIFAISVSFAGALLDIVGMEGGGFHLCGNSTKGKSTAQKAAASTWGNPVEFMRSWRTTSNGLEGVASLHNDSVLILDEIKEVAPKEAGAAAYMLGNGCAKTRMSRDAVTRKTATWKLLLLSSGEIGLPELMRQAGERANAGQEIRVAEITIGDFENHHGYATPGQFADAVKENSGKYYGAVGIEFLQKLVETRAIQAPLIRESVDRFITNKDIVPVNASGQVVRVARRFGLIGAAGELATDFGLTGWPQGEAIKAAQACFKSWLENFGTGDRETAAVLAQVQLFFEQNGASRFQAWNDLDDGKIINRAGFYKLINPADPDGKNPVDYTDPHLEKKYFVLPETLKHEVCKGLNFKTAVKALINAGWLEPGSDTSAQKHRIPYLKSKPTNVYVFNGKMWEAESC